MKKKKCIKNNLDGKNGFTLIEIIISIVLLILIGGTTTFLLLNKKDDKENEVNKITNQVLEAANVYVNSMKDEKGNSFLKEISKGAKGVKIPLSLLVSKGLIDEKVIDDIDDYMAEKHNSYTRPSNESYYILYLQGGTVEGVNYCEQDSITIASWTMDLNETVYLCNDYKQDNNEGTGGSDTGTDNSGTDANQESEPNIVDAQKVMRFTVDLKKFAVSQDFYNNATTEQKEYLTASENGIFTYYNESTKKIFWYYRGAVNNNYLKFGEYTSGDKKGQPLYWRVLWMNDQNEMKIILDETIPLIFKNSLNESIPVESNTTLYRLFKSGGLDFYYFNPTSVSHERKYGNRFVDDYYTYKIYNYNKVTDSVWETLNDVNGYDGVYTKNTFWVNNNSDWYNTTNLYKFSYILNKNLCSNPCGDDNEKNYPSDNFECLTGYKSSRNGCQYKEYETSPNKNKVGFLTYGDAVRAGIISTNFSINLSNSGNYLVDSINNYNILIGDRRSSMFNKNDKGYYEDVFINYYYNSRGISYEKIVSNKRGSSSDTYSDFYTLVDENDNILLKEVKNYGSSGYILYQEKFIANALKPTLTINMSKRKLVGNGTKESPFELVNK